MQPHSPHLPPLTGKSVSRLANGLLARIAALSTYAAYSHSQLLAGTGAPFCCLSRPPTTQNNPFSPSKMAVFFRSPVEKVVNCAFFLHLSGSSYFHLRHLQPFTPIYTPARNPHLHTYPPFKGGKCEWWGGAGTNKAKNHHCNAEGGFKCRFFRIQLEMI
jgi:hypothetical protein